VGIPWIGVFIVVKKAQGAIVLQIIRDACR